MRIVGVADDVHEESVEGETGWQIYYPATQQNPNGAELVVRTTLPPATLASSVMGMLREMNPKQPAAEFKPIQMLVDHANSPRRFFMLLVAAFATLGLLLAALGHLRRDFVLGDAADAGDRHPHGAGIERGPRTAGCAHRNLAAGGDRHSAGVCGIGRRGTADRVAAVCDFRVGL